MSELTMLKNLVDPQVLADMIAAKLEKKIKALPYARVNTTLEGRAGSEITIPRWKWDGEAEIVAEGAEIPLRNIGTETVKYSIHKIGVGSSITDEALLSGYGDPMGATTAGIARSILDRCDNDMFEELAKASTVYDANTASADADKKMSYNAVVRAVDCFYEEENSEKVMFVDPKQVTELRLDSNFIDKTKYGNNVMIDGEIGMIANTRIVVSKKVAKIGGCYYNPIIKLTNDAETEDDMPAVTYFIKRGTNVETERKPRTRTTEITADQNFVIALTNDEKVVLAKLNGAALQTSKMYHETYKYPGTNVVLDTQGVKTELANTGANAYTLKAMGVAPKISATDAATLGFSASVTNAYVALIGIPQAPLKGFEATKVKLNGNAVTANDIMYVGAEPYLILVNGIWDNDGTITGANASFTLAYDNGTAQTMTYNYDGIKLA